MGFRDNRQSKRMLEKMGLNLEEMPNVDEFFGTKDQKW